MEELGDDQVRDLIVDWRPQEDDPLVEQPGVDVERALAARGLFDDHGDQWAHDAVSFVPGVQSFGVSAGCSFSGVQIDSRASCNSGAIGFTSAAIRSRARFNLM